MNAQRPITYVSRAQVTERLEQLSASDESLLTTIGKGMGNVLTQLGGLLKGEAPPAAASAAAASGSVGSVSAHPSAAPSLVLDRSREYSTAAYAIAVGNQEALDLQTQRANDAFMSAQKELNGLLVAAFRGSQLARESLVCYALPWLKLQLLNECIAPVGKEQIRAWMVQFGKRNE